MISKVFICVVARFPVTYIQETTNTVNHHKETASPGPCNINIISNKTKLIMPLSCNGYKFDVHFDVM